MSARSEYKKVSGDNYDVPCLNFLMNLQDGKEATEYDKKIIYKLSNSYHLTPPVINVLLEYGLRNCNNSLIENYLYPIASDLHRNDISTSAAAKQRLYTPYEKKKNTFRRSEEKLPVYDDSSNQTMSASQEEELLKLMGKK
jgi:replication initiation and membrane attachment protein DnaB